MKEKFNKMSLTKFNKRETEKMEFEFALMKLPQWLGQTIKLKESELTKQKFDIVNKSEDNLAFCELKIKDTKNHELHPEVSRFTQRDFSV